jgi:hypothetical protein
VIRWSACGGWPGWRVSRRGLSGISTPPRRTPDDQIQFTWNGAAVSIPSRAPSSVGGLDLVRLVLGDRDEVVCQVTPLSEVKQCNVLPCHGAREDLVALAALVLDAADNSEWLLSAAELVDDRIFRFRNADCNISERNPRNVNANGSRKGSSVTTRLAVASARYLRTSIRCRRRVNGIVSFWVCRLSDSRPLTLWCSERCPGLGGCG